MVKGISKQVIVVHSPDKKFFDQAIFILSDDAISKSEITDEMLLREAKRIARGSSNCPGRRSYLQSALYAGLGASLTAVLWVLTSIL